MVFAKLRADSSRHYTYLMWKRGVGFRIGMTRGVRSSKDGKIVSGLQVRANQEVADAIWILHSSTSAAEARYFEQFYATKYGIPTMVFFVRGRRMDMTQDWVDRLYNSIKTDDAAARLMEDLGLDRRYPHHRPGAVTRSGAGAAHIEPWARRHVLFTMFGDGRPFQLKSWHEHRVQLVTSDPELKTRALERFRVRDGVRGAWRIETSRKDYDDGLDLARQITSLSDDMELIPRARLTEHKAFLLMPMSHVHPGMLVPVVKEGKVIECEVESVERQNYEGPVFDLSIPNTRNYVANGIVVHNSIYAWRGADIQNILDFETDYSDAKVVRLEQNYRSTKTILQIASELIARNSQRKKKTLWTENDQGDKALLILCADEYDEADTITAELQRLHKQGYDWNKMAIFYRINALSRVMEKSLFSAKVPYQIARGVEFYGRKEIKDVLAYLRFIANPNDEVSLERIINVPTRGIGDSAVQHLQAWAVAHGISMFDAMQRLDEVGGLSTRAINSIRNFIKLVQEWRKSAQGKPVKALMENVVQRSGMEALLEKLGAEEQEQMANVNELITAAKEYDEQNPEGSLVDYLAQVSLVSDVDKLKDTGGAVTLMTLHAAKGLEFPVVVIMGLEEGCLPHARARDNPDDMEEERRLCFVGITRAQERLVLTSAGVRTIRGLRAPTITSPFIRELPRESLEVMERSGTNRFGRRSARSDSFSDIEPQNRVSQFREGQLVRHPTFGLGRITEISDMGSQTLATIEFKSVGQKKLILEYARLEPAG